MRSLRSLGLLALYVGAQLVALVLAFPFKSAGLSSTSNPNSPTSPLYIIAVIIIAPLLILYIARLKGGLATLRGLILVGIAASLNITLQASFALALPSATWQSPLGFGLILDWSIPLSSVVAVGLFLTLLLEPHWYVVDLVGFVAGGSLIALLGISFGILPALILLSALAVYDFVAVYRTKHMLSLADAVVEMKLPILLVVPADPGYDYRSQSSFQAQRNKPSEEREAMFMGLGDIVIPGTLVVSAFVWLPATVLVPGIGGNLVVALGAMAGSLVGYGFLMRLVNRGNAQAGLPLLNGGAIAGYVVSYLLVFHSLSMGISLNF
jgi:presenilin-like A22 family membrane protease